MGHGHTVLLSAQRAHHAPQLLPRASRWGEEVVTIRTALIAVLLAVTACQEPDDGGGYIDTYGGNPIVYQRIAAETDCAALQAEFDQAAANNDLAEPGTSQHRQTTGYMVAADDRMQEIGCY